jgi:hypothetical protein
MGPLGWNTDMWEPIGRHHLPCSLSQMVHPGVELIIGALGTFENIIFLHGLQLKTQPSGDLCSGKSAWPHGEWSVVSGLS